MIVTCRESEGVARYQLGQGISSVHFVPSTIGKGLETGRVKERMYKVQSMPILVLSARVILVPGRIQW
jgi:hypothetical protein